MFDCQRLLRSASVVERVCVSWCVWVLGHEGVGVVKLYVVVSEEAGGNVGGGVEGDGGGVGVECVGDVAGDSIGRDLSEVARSAVAEAVATATVGV